MHKKNPKPNLHKLRMDVVYDDISLAPVLSVSPSTVKRWRLSGKLPYRQDGKGKVFILPEDVLEFLAKFKKVKALLLLLFTDQLMGLLDFL